LCGISSVWGRHQLGSRALAVWRQRARPCMRTHMHVCTGADGCSPTHTASRACATAAPTTPHPHPPTHPPTHQPISTRPLCYTRRFPEGEWQSYKDDNLWRETSAGPDPLLFHTLLQCTLTGDCSPRPSPPPKKTMTCTQVP
jgi:hypothetical protein